jgi:hypothetical protein
MNTNSKLFAIAIAVTSLAMAPSLFNINSAAAVTHWCEQQGKSNNWVVGCKSGWYDKDHCLKSTNDGDTKDMVAGYKAGYEHGTCKK